jgi:hypothetical protein
MLGDFRIEELAMQCSEAFEGAVLVGADQPRIPRHLAARMAARRRVKDIAQLSQRG